MWKLSVLMTIMRSISAKPLTRCPRCRSKEYYSIYSFTNLKQVILKQLYILSRLIARAYI